MTTLNYTKALETRLRWLRWAHESASEVFPKSEHTTRGLNLYKGLLAHGETYVMNRRFCELVDLARRTIPDDLEFETEWLTTPSGWMWLEEPFSTPQIVGAQNPMVDFDGRVAAVGWSRLPDELVAGEKVLAMGIDGEPIPVEPGSVEFATFWNREATPGLTGFGMWSFFVVQPGETVIERIRSFEKMAVAIETEGTYQEGRLSDVLHEVRWLYAAMHLMSQRLAVTVEHQAERALRRRWERERSPLPPFLRVVTLRRMEEARARDPRGQEVDWQWQWPVTGHWRNQWYPSEQRHKAKWIDEYVKGPEDKPFKPPSLTVFKVDR